MSLFDKFRKKRPAEEAPRVCHPPIGGVKSRTDGIEFAFAKPELTLPFAIRERDLDRYFGVELRHNCEGYYTLVCLPFKDLRCTVGFHFEKGRLTKLEFFRERKYYEENGGRGTVKDSFEEFQRVFEREYGQPHSTEDGASGFPAHTWNFETFDLRHSVFERFGPNEILELTLVSTEK